ncbi:SCO7613 C-terminal domain-containing membrane protein [Marisediminicola senii]|uniref:SCO7613 C-terminal domain-containing membrane protein n=1 Tax=Marisediminicola senii TaxID=2711233 RepID=UPI0013EC8B41|nr:hypothetical protein [Marisediminicola senii]
MTPDAQGRSTASTPPGSSPGSSAGSSQRPIPSEPWSRVAITQLLDRDSCPVCQNGQVTGGTCAECGADLNGPVGAELWKLSRRAAMALRARQVTLDRVPVRGPARAAAAAAPGAATAVLAPGARPARSPETAASAGYVSVTAPPPPAAPPRAGDGTPTPPAPQSSATLQSVLAVAGAGLVAIAAIVFTFFNPDLTDRSSRSGIVGIVTALFLGGAWLLARRRLQFSAEAIGGLGTVFLALDVYALTAAAPVGTSPWAVAAVGTLVAGAGMTAAAAFARIRTWLWVGVLGLTAVPVMAGFAASTGLAVVVGMLGCAAVALGMADVVRGVASRFDGTLTAERHVLAIAQATAVVTAVFSLSLIGAGSNAEYWLTVSAVLAAVGVLAVASTRQLAPRAWSAVAGASAAGAAVTLALALDLDALLAPGSTAAPGSIGAVNDPGVAGGLGLQWHLALAPLAGALALVAVAALPRLPRSVDRAVLTAGAFWAAVASVLPSTVTVLLVGAATAGGAALGGAIVVMDAAGVLAAAVGIAAASTGFATLAGRTGRHGGRMARWTHPVGSLAAWLGVLAALVVACLPSLSVAGQVTVALGLAVAGGLALTRIPRVRGAAVGIRGPVIVGAHLALVLGGLLSWNVGTVTVPAGAAIVLAIGVLSTAMPPGSRAIYVGGGYAYALVVVAAALGQVGVGTIAMLCLTTSIGLVGAIVATFVRSIRPAYWYAILVVASVPFVLGVVQVVFERSGWTAMSTGIMFLFAATLLVSRRPGLGMPLRTLAAGLLVPSLAVAVVCLGAEVLVGSASPVTLPVIAAIVAVVLPTTGLVRSTLTTRGLAEPDARAARIAIEASALLTGCIAVGLALGRVAAGLPTTFLVLVILGVGSALASTVAGRRYGWWVAAACATGALWCLLAMAGIGVLTVEPYLLPPTLGAAVVGMAVTVRGGRGRALYAVGLTLAVTPTLVVLAAGAAQPASTIARGYALVAASWALLVIGSRLGRGVDARAARLGTLRAPTLLVAILAGAAGAVLGVLWGSGHRGTGLDVVVPASLPLVIACIAIGVAGAVPAAVAARLLARDAAGARMSTDQGVSSPPSAGEWVLDRWLYAPAALYVGVAAWTAIDRDWHTIWTMWALMLAYLLAVVAIAARSRTRATHLPPVWFVFALAFTTAIVAWSPRDLRVEWFSLPLGVFLLAAGVLTLRSPTGAGPSDARGTLASWPARWTGSWALLAPGIIVMMLASILATFTDPLTWRAILVMAIALGAILVGASRRLAAPFMIGIIVLPIENVFVFAVQIGRGIDSMPWWITLAVVGAVLLIIAVTYERRDGAGAGISARLRDLA